MQSVIFLVKDELTGIYRQLCPQKIGRKIKKWGLLEFISRPLNSYTYFDRTVCPCI